MHLPKLPAAAAVAATLALLFPGQRARAQNASEMEVRLEAGAATNSPPGTVPFRALALTPSIRYATNRFTVRARGAAWHDNNQWHLGDASASAQVFAPLRYGVRAELSAGASHLFHDYALQSDQVDAEARLHWMQEKGGIWLGSGVTRPLRVGAVSSVNVSSGGIWTSVGPTTLRGSVTSFFFTKLDTTTQTNRPECARNAFDNTTFPEDAASTDGCRHSSRLTDVEGSFQWRQRLLELTFRGGHRFGDSLDIEPRSERWASMQAAVWITSQVAAVAGGGTEPAQPARGFPARRFASLGLMLAYWPIPRQAVLVTTPASLIRAFELRPAGTALQRLTARIGGVETVEIMGDFTDWTPVPLLRQGRDQWELLIPMSPGVHQINLRIDGGLWIAPPGIPSIKDGFNGEVGVLVIKP
ncbi:MAG: glycogen-binding domain-containing protein [Gemmatimonadaceae bacterium]